jgi:hypothetical protein
MRRLVTVAVLLLLCASPVVAQPARGPRANGANPQQVAAMNWVRDHMPNLYRLAMEGRPRSRWTNVIANHYRLFMNSANMPVAREKLLATFNAEDKIFGMVIELERAPEDQRPAIQDNIRNATRDLLLKNFQDRADRIAKLQKELETQAAQLKSDRDSIDMIVARQAQNRFGVEPGPTTSPATRPDAEAQPPAGEPVTAPQP